MNMPDPMPVPNVSTSTTARHVASGPEAHLGEPGGVGVVDDVHVGAARLGEQRVGVLLTQAWSRLAALRITPWRTTPGNVTPTCPCQPKCSTSSATTGAIDVGVAGWGVRILKRSAVSSPVAMLTGAAFIPEPPMSIPNACSLVTSRHCRRRSEELPEGAAEAIAARATRTDRVDVAVSARTGRLYADRFLELGEDGAG